MKPHPSFSSLMPAWPYHTLTHPPFIHLGVFFLFGAGRLALIRSQPHLAISYYTQAMHAQKQYRNLHYISYWEMAISYLALWDLSGSLGCWRVLEAEGNVSLLLSFHLSVWIFRVFLFFFASRYDWLHQLTPCHFVQYSGVKRYTRTAWLYVSLNLLRKTRRRRRKRLG